VHLDRLQASELCRDLLDLVAFVVHKGGIVLLHHIQQELLGIVVAGLQRVLLDFRVELSPRDDLFLDVVRLPLELDLTVAVFEEAIVHRVEHADLDGHLVPAYQGYRVLGAGGAGEPVRVLQPRGLDEGVPIAVGDLLVHLLLLGFEQVAHWAVGETVPDDDGVVQQHYAAVVSLADEVVVPALRGPQETLPLDGEVVGVLALHRRFVCPEELDAVVDLLLGFPLEAQVVEVLADKSVPLQLFLVAREARAVPFGHLVVLLQVLQEALEFADGVLPLVEGVSIALQRLDDFLQEGLLLVDLGHLLHVLGPFADEVVVEALDGCELAHERVEFTHDFREDLDVLFAFGTQHLAYCVQVCDFDTFLLLLLAADYHFADVSVGITRVGLAGCVAGAPGFGVLQPPEPSGVGPL